MITSDGRSVRGIGGTRKSIGTATIKIPFKDLGVIDYVFFLLMAGRFPTFLCMTDVCRHGLENSVLRCKVIFTALGQDLRMVN